MVDQVPTEEYGLGLIPSVPDERDWMVSSALLGLEAISIPSSYAAPGMPPVLNQGNTPMCVAYSASAQKAWQDRRDQGKFFDFNEPLFFYQIGGTAAGAAVRNALVRMVNYGYPVVTAGDAVHHKIRAYYAVPKTIADIQIAILQLGPVTLGVNWMNSWFHPINGILPKPDYIAGGHAIEAYGWDGRGLRLRNSWGTGYGLSGDVFMPWAYVLGSAVFEVWKSVDVIEGTCKVKVVDTMYSAVRQANIAAGHTVYGYSELHPGAPVTKFTAPADRGSSFHVDRKRNVSWPAPCTTNPVPHGTFLRGTDGVFAGLLVVPSAVTAADGKAW